MACGLETCEGICVEVDVVGYPVDADLVPSDADVERVLVAGAVSWMTASVVGSVLLEPMVGRDVGDELFQCFPGGFRLDRCGLELLGVLPIAHPHDCHLVCVHPIIASFLSM